MLGQLIASAPILPTSLHNTISLAITRLRTNFQGSFLEFARFANLSEGPLRFLMSGKHLPEIGTLLHLCLKFNTTIVELISNNTDIIGEPQNHDPIILTTVQEGELIPISEPQIKILEARLEIIARITANLEQNTTPPIPAYSAAKMLGLSLIEFKSNHLGLYTRLAARYNNYIERRKDKIKRILEAEIEMPSTQGLNVIAAYYGYSPKMLIYYFPDLCGQVINQNRENRKQDHREMQLMLEAELTCYYPPSSLEDIVKYSGYYLGTLRHNFSELITQIQERSKKYKKEADIQFGVLVKRETTSYPPLSLRQVSRKIGYSTWSIRNRFPDWVQIIKQRHSEYLLKENPEPHQKIRDTLWSVMTALHIEGYYPSGPRVVRASNGTLDFRDPIVHSSWKEFLIKLGYEK